MTQPAQPTEPKIDGLSNEVALEEIGRYIDMAYEAQSASATEHALALLDELKQRALAPEVVVLTHYYRANAWENKRIAQGHDRSWDWEQTETQEQILELRRALLCVVFLVGLLYPVWRLEDRQARS